MFFQVAPGETVSNYVQLAPAVWLFLYPRSRDTVFQSGARQLQRLLPGYSTAAEPQAATSDSARYFYVDDTTADESGRRLLRDLLPGYSAADVAPPTLPPEQCFAALENLFYIDIATAAAGGQFVARRRLTLLAFNHDGSPASGIRVEWSRERGSAALRFLDASGTAKEALTGNDAVTTDSHGMAEVTLQHPSTEVAEADRTLRILAQVSSLEVALELRIVRNERATQLNDLLAQEAAEHLWVFQPVANSRTPRNEGIVELQEMLNEVVSRHRAIQPFNFIPLDGVFSERTRDVLRSYLTHFATIDGKGDYPYDLQEIGLSQELEDYLRKQYAPFDPDTAQGCVVDRHLLIGERRDTAPAAIDGLAELYEGVVQRLKQEMVRVADSYINNNTFWLHRTTHLPYQAATTWCFRCTAQTTLKAQPTPQAPDLTLEGGPLTLTPGECFPSPALQGNWAQVVHPAGTGWVRMNTGRRILDDQSLAQNAGTHGGAGVAYSFGCKDLPATYAARLRDNAHAPAENGEGNRSRIASWDEYQQGHRVGRMSAEDGWAGDNQIPYHTGCDCSGFTQNCITESLLSNNMRVVPQGLLSAIRVNTNRVPLDTVGSGDFVGATAYARPIPHPGTDDTLNWVRQGDIIANTGHIVWCAEERPNVLNNNNTFEVFNEYGSYTYQLPNGVTAPLDTQRFLRKALRMPFHYWRRTLQGLELGKAYIWR
ncbi:hypothetical protein JQX13_35630 [Archangium violaceum]|uniref:hypothetical protein n=1 Tax=Archangium violaceum TaxID=83451 RepID=UPI00193B89C9|nr:hypothetical protein [Archangium violaceum]QRK05468.1 hypothetical protein JQX13_35630 [Archangium violaceum]